MDSTDKQEKQRKEEIKEGKALVRVGSHRAREKLILFLGYKPQGYFKWYKRGEWREVPEDKVEELLKEEIKGISRSKWDEDLRQYIDWG